MRRRWLNSCILLAFAAGCSVRVGVAPRVPPTFQPVDTTAWVTHWSDDFNRAEPGEQWRPMIGTWSVKHGALMGRLTKDQSTTIKNYAADVILQHLPLPEVVEIRYETWSPAEIGSEAKLLSDDGTQGVIAALYGTPHPALQEKAAIVFLMMGTNRFETAAANQKFAFTPNVHHKVRIVRQAEGITAFVDGEQVVSAALGARPQNREPNLHLVGSFGKEGSEVFFDSVEIRVPADHREKSK